jgi:hypothetical protein
LSMADTRSTHARADHAVVHHETSDVNTGGIFRFAAGLLLTGVAIHLLVWLLVLFLAARDARHAMPEFPLAAGQESRVPPEPRLQTNPRQDLRDLRDAEDTVLTGYGWVDRNAGIARIPIGEAMKLTVERGLPARQENPR